MDTSWEVVWKNISIVIDPWLVGSEVDYFKWFNEQWHQTNPIHPSKIKSPNFILISQSYSDHTHEETIRLFDRQVPILASPKAHRRLIKSFSKGRLIKLPLLYKQGFLEFEGLKIATIDPGNKLDPVYYAHIIAHGHKAIFYSSHGFELSLAQLEILKDFKIEVLMTSFSEIKLPKILGGRVNPGIENVNYLINTLKPSYILNTHDEQKKSKGVVMKMARCTYPDLENINFDYGIFKNLENFEFQNFEL